MPSVISGDANVSATEFGYLDGVTSSLQSQIDAKLPLAGGKILQIVRATDSTDRSTTSTSFVDASLSVTIAPQYNTSAIILICNFNSLCSATVDNLVANFQLTDASNNVISGSENHGIGTYNVTGTGTRNFQNSSTLWAYATPATTSAVTYKLRFKISSSSTVTIRNATNTGQLYAIEVSA